MKTLIIAEKVSVRDAIATALGSPKIGRDPIYYKDYIITNLYGHILELKEPEDFDESYKKWSMDQLPIYFNNWGLKPKDSAKEKLKMIGELLQEADEVIHAGDPDDEGQLLVDEVLGYFKYKGKVWRVDTSVTEKETLAKKLNSLKDNNEYKPEGYAAYARSISDMVVGVNMSRFFTLLYGGKTLSVGRVQTPTLGLVVKRDEIIENHIKQLYYIVNGNMEIDGKVVPITVRIPKDDPRLTDGKLLNKSEAEKIVDYLADKIIPDVEITKKVEYEQPPLPFNLVELQTYCGNKFNYSPKEVMQITQDLKDKFKAISYNRTDCQYLSTEHFEEAPRTTSAVCKSIGFTPSGLDTTIKSRAFNDEKISVHFAIIPTNTVVDMNKLSEKERNVYLAICKYYLAQFLPPAKKLKTSLKRETKIGTISSTSTEILENGFRSIFKESEEPERSALSSIDEGTYDGETDELRIDEKETKAPPRYTQTSLNKDMTCISKYVEDPEIKELLLAKDKDKEANGSIGTDATRDSIIERLIKRGYLKEEKKKLISTELGRKFFHALPDELKKPDMTAKWWLMQEQIKKREIDVMDLPKSVLATCEDIMGRNFDKTAMPESKKSSVLGKCPKCGEVVFKTKKGGAVCKGFFDKKCDFSLWPEFMHKKMTEDIFKELLENGVTLTPVKGLKTKNGSLSSVLMLDDEYKIQLKG